MTVTSAIDIYALRKVCDPLDEAIGFPLLDPYIELVYGSILGPTSLQLLRMLDRMHRPGTHTLVDIDETAAVLGVKCPVARRSLGRLQRFGVARVEGTTIVLRSHLTPVDGAALERLPSMARGYHEIVILARSPFRLQPAESVAPGGVEPPRATSGAFGGSAGSSHRVPTPLGLKGRCGIPAHLRRSPQAAPELASMSSLSPLTPQGSPATAGWYPAGDALWVEEVPLCP